VIPNLFTMTNLFCGFSSIVRTMEGNYKLAAVMIVLGGVFDALDGVMARLTKSSSEFGVELDSLADVVSFCLAPSVLIYKIYFHQFDPPGMVLAAMPAICGALRLARFNVQLVGFDKDYFRGLPSPAAALTIVAFVYFLYDSSTPAAAAQTGLWLGSISVAVSLLMVSTVKYDTQPKLSRRAIGEHPIRFALFIVGITLVLATKGEALFPVISLYVVFGLVRWVVTAVKRRFAPEEDEDEEEEAREVG
jgi:CDP-diacylglycerol--serine O-phosphatidyltransferase